MTEPPPRTDQASARLGAAVHAVSDALADFEAALFGVNDETLVEAFQAPLQIGRDLIAFHSARAAATVADDAANLRSLIARHHIPREDPELGATGSLTRLRSARGSLLADLDDLLVAAALLGLRPRAPSLLPPTIAQVERPGVAGLLAGLERRLSLVQRELDALRPEAAAEAAHTPQQVAIVNFFVENASLQVAVARLETKAPGPVDFATLTRAVEAMAELARNFVVSVRAMQDKMTQSLRAASETIRPLVGRVAKGLVAVIYRVRRTVRPAVLSDPSSPPTPSLADETSDDESIALIILRDVLDCTDDIAREVLKAGAILDYEGGASILKQNEVVSAAFLILSGRANAMRYGLEGMAFLAGFERGDFFAAVGEPDMGHVETEIIAIENATAFVIGSASLVALAERYDSVGLALSRLLFRQFRRTTARTGDNDPLTAMGRVCDELLQLARHSPGMKIAPPPVLSELAVRVMTTRETLSRALSALERKGIIRRDADSLAVLSPAWLEDLIV
jgi:CRP/FNR family cyclic AMP-dependent transcriptional regulator